MSQSAPPTGTTEETRAAPHRPRTRRAVFMSRVLAKAVDMLVVVALGALVPHPLGPLLGFLYSIFGDGMRFRSFAGQSIGKKLFRLGVWSTRRKASGNYRDALIRNIPIGVATFFALIPVWGWLILGIIGVPLMIMELYLMLTVGKGRRLGDVMADTEVVISTG